ncbi:MAG: (cytosine-5-)-methyltransferase [Fibrobacterota bacterium]|jgi:DNA (cytosine-5)-methyltransferase 1
MAVSDLELLGKVMEIWDQAHVAAELNKVSPGEWTREAINRWVNGKCEKTLSRKEAKQLQGLLPAPDKRPKSFRFVDLFAGIGGIRQGFSDIGGECVFTSEWNPFAVKTYKANHPAGPHHVFNADIREVTCSANQEMSEDQAYEHIRSVIPEHEVLLAGFPCQPFSIAGVSKKNSLGRKHGFECDTQGTLFFDVARILKARRPPFFLLENVKNLKSHDKGKTFNVILKALDELGYHVADVEHDGTHDPKIIDAVHFVPQHRERIVLVGFRKDLDLHEGFTLADIKEQFPERKPVLADVLDPEDPAYILTPRLWEYLYYYAMKHKEKGNGFGFGLVDETMTTRTLSARYYKDGSEILIDRGFKDSRPFDHPTNLKNRPRRLTPRECSRLMGFDRKGESRFRIPVSDTQAYKQFGNSVAVPVFAAVARMLKPRIAKYVETNGITLD